MPQPRRAVVVGGIPFEISRLEDASTWLMDVLREPNRRGLAVRLANAYCVALASRTDRYGDLLRGDGVNFPDGLSVVASMRALTRSTFPRRVRGPSFFRWILRDGVEHGVRHFFLGSTQETLKDLVDAVHAAYPDALVAGAYSPPFGDVDRAYLDALLERARQWEADIIWVGMGTPKQDYVAQALADELGVVAIGVGAAFDFVAGTADEAPRWVQRAGIEWAYRLAKEPRRLWQRYLFGNARFAGLVARQLLGGRARAVRPSHRGRGLVIE